MEHRLQQEATFAVYPKDQSLAHLFFLYENEKWKMNTLMICVMFASLLHQYRLPMTQICF